MIKTFKHKLLTIKLKSTILKDRVCYFGETELEGLFTEAYNDMRYKTTLSTEFQLLEIYKFFKARGLKPVEISLGDLSYTGDKMGMYETQEIKEEA